MKFKKILTVVFTLCMVYVVVPFSEKYVPESVISSSAKDTDVTYGNLKYRKSTYYTTIDGIPDRTITEYGVIGTTDKNITEANILAEVDGLPVTNIDLGTFRFCSELTSVIIPDSVTSIGEYAFSECHKLTSVTIPDSVTSIGERAFYECLGLTSVTIPDSVTSIGEGAFCECSELISVTIPKNLTSIEENVFRNSGLTSVTIQEGITSIGHSAFSKCSKLTSVTIPKSVTSIGEGAFYGTPWLKEKQEENPLVIVNEILIDGTACEGDIIIPESVTSIGDGAFIGCLGLTSVTIPDSVTSIGSDAFAYCSELTSITIPDSVTSIGFWAFSECTELTSITIKNSDCEIDGSSLGLDINNFNGVIYGYENSTTQAYAEKYGYKFESLGAAPKTNKSTFNDAKNSDKDQLKTTDNNSSKSEATTSTSIIKYIFILAIVLSIGLIIKFKYYN